ncbi:MAG TPA: LssY C-terminal domain-containing protein [Planctomycetaceae bacterium]|nr:LssY C-terminal domain-containing protein [Planctomycetaceae bacterium]
MLSTLWRTIERVVITPYHPVADDQSYLQRSMTQMQSDVTVTVAIPDSQESHRLFGVPLAHHGLQAVYLRVVNGSAATLRFQFRTLDPRYATPLEAAASCHFSILRRLYGFGLLGWLISPLLLLIPLKLVSAQWANQRMDHWFQSLGFHRRPIAPGDTAGGFVFTTLDAGTKIVRVYLMAMNSGTAEAAITGERVAALRDVDLTFTLPVPNLAVDYEHRQLAQRAESADVERCHINQLIERLKTVAAVTTDRHARGHGDPLNLVVIGSFESLQEAFIGRWDETEVITLATCWKTVRAFLLGSEYRYSPVSPLYLFGRCQDIALQQIRNSINVRLHLRLWLAPFRLHDHPVWVGQISRDIGVRFTTKVWNLTTHRIDPDVDESRDYVLDDLLDVERVEAAGHVIAMEPSTASSPRHNLTGDPYFTDGRRVVILLSSHRTPPRFIDWSSSAMR